MGNLKMVHMKKEKKLQFYPSAQDPGPKQITVGGSSDLTCFREGSLQPTSLWDARETPLVEVN